MVEAAIKYSKTANGGECEARAIVVALAGTDQRIFDDCRSYYIMPWSVNKNRNLLRQVLSKIRALRRDSHQSHVYARVKALPFTYWGERGTWRTRRGVRDSAVLSSLWR